MSKILIVADDQRLIKQIKDWLDGFGYISDSVTGTTQLLLKLDQEPFDLILLDVTTPGADGLTLLKQLKTHPLYQTIPVMVLTTDMDEQMLAACFDHGATDFISQPIQVLALKARVNSALASLSYLQEIEARKKALQQEIAERRRVEEILRQERDFAENLIETAQVIILVLDPAGRIVCFNPYLEEISGYRLEEVQGQDWFSTFLPGSDHDRIRALFFQAIDNIQTRGNVNPILTKSGQLRQIEWYDKTLKDADGQTIGLLAIGLDITERMQAEQALRQHRAHLEELVKARTTELLEANTKLQQEIVERKQIEESLQIKDSAIASSINAIALADLAGKLTYVNDSFLKLWGYESEQEVLGRPAVEFWANPEKAKEVVGVLQNKGDWIGELVASRRDGSKVTLQLSANLINNKAGQPLAMMASFVDVNDQKQAEAQLKASLQEKEVLLKEIHHRVKNNMQIISSLLDLQVSNIADETVRELFKESQHRIKSMALIHERLYQSRDLARIDFAEYVESLTAHLLRSYGAKVSNVVLQLDIAPLFLSIELAIPCGLIINELVSNAFKHAFPNDRAGQVCIELQPVADQQLALLVGDNGVGFPPEIDFRQTTSLGLTLVMTLVKQLKGAITLDGQVGTTFKITFTDSTVK